MRETVLASLGIASGVLNLVGLIPYIRDIFRHKTKPERASWWVFLALSAFALIGQVQAGSRWSLVATITDTVTEGLIAVCSIWYGYGKLHRRDWISLAIAALGIFLAQVLKSPLVALLIVIGVDTAGMWLTLYKTWAAPHSETLISWVLATIAPALSILAVGSLNFAQLVYPFYIFIANGLMVYVIVTRRPHVAHDAADV